MSQTPVPPAAGVVRVVDPRDATKWDEGLAEFDDATFFHTASWARVLVDTYGFRPCSLVVEDEGRLRGLLPLIEADNWPRGRRGVSLPFTDECASLGDDRELVEAAMEEGRRRGWTYLELRGGADARGGAHPSITFYGHQVLLEAEEASMLRRFDPAVQRAIRKATKEGVTAEIGTTIDDVKTFYRLHCKTRRKHGVPPQSFRFFESIHRNVLEKRHGLVMLARLAGKAIAGAVFFFHGRNAIYKFGASDERYQEVRGNNLVMWEAMRWLSSRGCCKLDLGRTPAGNEGLRRFKSSWGATESRTNYYKYDFRRGRFVEDQDHASGWMTKLLRVLPGPTFRWAGTWLYPRLA